MGYFADGFRPVRHTPTWSPTIVNSSRSCASGAPRYCASAAMTSGASPLMRVASSDSLSCFATMADAAGLTIRDGVLSMGRSSPTLPWTNRVNYGNNRLFCAIIAAGQRLSEGCRSDRCKDASFGCQARWEVENRSCCRKENSCEYA